MNYQFKKAADINQNVTTQHLDEKAAAQAYRDLESRERQPKTEVDTTLVGHGIQALATESAICEDERQAKVLALFNNGMTSYIDLAFEMNLAESTIRQYGRELGLKFIDTEY